jgi:hypothetical protein
MQLHAKHPIISRKLIIAAATVLAGAAVGTILTIAWASPAPIAQSITFTSVPPAAPVPGSTYHVTAKGGASGNPVTFTIDSQSTPTCSLSSSSVTFNRPGRCVIDANQAGNATYAAAPQDQQAITVNRIVKPTQSISFTAPASGPVGGSANLSATGGGSGNPVVFSVDPSSAPGVCTVSGTNGSTVSYTAAGSCVIDANQAGSASYTAAAPVTATITVYQAPAFVIQSPPLATRAGLAYDYAFAASGNPAPTYALASGAPSWLSVNAVTGEVTGTPPLGITSFSYTVTAINPGGKATAGPFTVTVAQAIFFNAGSSAALSCPASMTVDGTGTCTLTVANAMPATASKVVAGVPHPGLRQAAAG